LLDSLLQEIEKCVFIVMQCLEAEVTQQLKPLCNQLSSIADIF